MACIGLIKTKYGHCITKRCEKNKCRIYLGELEESAVIIDGDLYKERLDITKKICDCIIFCHAYERLIVGLIECKSKNVDISHAEEQLDESLIYVNSILKEINIKKCEIFPLILSKSIHTVDRRMLNSKRINIRGKETNIFYKTCKSYLELGDILEEFKIV